MLYNTSTPCVLDLIGSDVTYLITVVATRTTFLSLLGYVGPRQHSHLFVPRTAGPIG